MSRITAILETHPDGTVHLPVPADLRHGKIEVTAILRPAGGAVSPKPRATAEMLRRRKEALDGLRALGGLRDTIPDPVVWQRELRQDRPLPGRD